MFDFLTHHRGLVKYIIADCSHLPITIESTIINEHLNYFREKLWISRKSWGIVFLSIDISESKEKESSISNAS
jgi:hypothetical protein